MRLKWTNWQLYQTNTFQQVDYKLYKVILKCGYSWSPSMGANQPILLTPLRGDPDIDLLKKLGFELEQDIIREPSFENGFDYSGYLNAAWEALGITRDPNQSTPITPPPPVEPKK